MKYKKSLGFVCLLSFFLMKHLASAEEEQITEYQLESVIVGDKEQPALSHFIPWKGTSTPDKLQWDLDVKYDKTLDLIDKDVMLRSINIYDEMNMESSNTVE